MMPVSFTGRPIRIEFRPALRVHRNRFVSGERGAEVHAGSFLRQRLIVLDQALLRDGRERDRILLHEIFHFVWLRFGNEARSSWERLLDVEFSRRVRGEMGWSAEWRKRLLITQPQSRRRWREYCCESFCDTAAIEVLELESHDEITLGRSARRDRQDWMKERIAGRSLNV